MVVNIKSCVNDNNDYIIGECCRLPLKNGALFLKWSQECCWLPLKNGALF